MDRDIREGTVVHNFVNLYGCKIDKDCRIAPFVEIQKDVRIGDRCKIEAYAFIPTVVTIEDEALVDFMQSSRTTCDLQAMIDDEDYDELIINKYRLSLEAIRKYADEFSFWQRRWRTSRPSVCERDLLVAFLVRQLFDATFRETEGLLVLLDDYFDLDEVPDHSVLCKKNSSRRWLLLWKSSSRSFSNACHNGRLWPPPTLPASAAGSARRARLSTPSKRERTESSCTRQSRLTRSSC